MGTFNKLLIGAFTVCFILACKGSFIENDEIISNPDDFSNKDIQSEKRMIYRALNENKSNNEIKVLYNNEVEEYDDFFREVNFDTIAVAKIIKDSLAIENMGIENCKTLFIVHKMEK